MDSSFGIKKDFFVDDDYKLWVYLARLRAAMIKAREKELRNYGIRFRHSTIIYAIDVLGDKATPYEIANLIFREPHSIIEALGRMEKQGLIKKIRDFTTKKSLVRAELTEKGKLFNRQANKRESIHRILSALTDAQRINLVDCLETLWLSTTKELGITERVYWFKKDV